MYEKLKLGGFTKFMSRGKCFLAPVTSQGVYGLTSPCVPDYTKHPVTAVAGKNVQIGKSVFSGKFDQVKVGMYITKVIYNDPATIVFWSDDTKTMCKAQHGDKYNKEAGLALCILKKLIGGDHVASLLKEWVVDDVNAVDIKYLREKRKEAKRAAKAPTTIEAPKEQETTVVEKPKRGRPKKKITE